MPTYYQINCRIGPGGSPLKREIAREYRGLSSGLAGVGVTPKWSCKACTFLNSYKNAGCTICDMTALLSMMLSFENLRAMSDVVARTLFLVFGGGARLGLFFFPLQRCKRNTGDQFVGVGEDCVEVGRIGGAEDGSEKVDAKGGDGLRCAFVRICCLVCTFW